MRLSGGGGACRGFSLAVSSRQSHHQSLINPPDQVRPGAASSPPRPFPVVPPPPPGPGPDRPAPQRRCRFPAGFPRYILTGRSSRASINTGRLFFLPLPFPFGAGPVQAGSAAPGSERPEWTPPVTRHGRCFVGKRITSCLINSVSSRGPFTSERRALPATFWRSSRSRRLARPAIRGAPWRRGAGARRLL